MGRMDSVDWGGRRIGLGRCKKDGEGVWWNDRHPVMQIFFMGWAGGAECVYDKKGWVARKDKRFLGGWELDGKRH